MFFIQGDLMFRKLFEDRNKVCISFEGEEFFVDTDQSVASALLGEGHHVFRSSVINNQPRGAYCMMGICFECLLEINGRPNQQACMVPVKENMVIKRQVSSVNNSS